MSGPVVSDPVVSTVLRGQRAVLAKLGMDAHWRGAMVVAHAWREAGMEVIYVGHVTAAELAAIVLQEDPAVVGASTLSGNHLGECEQIVAALREADVDDVVLVVGGAIPPGDVTKLRAIGVDAVFVTGSSLQTMITELGELVSERAKLRRHHGGG